MTADRSVRLTPALALAYLQALSTDVRAALVLDAAGTPLAGEMALLERARALLGAAQPIARGTAADGATLLVARVPDGPAIAVVAGPHALAALLEHDLRTLLDDLVQA